MKENFDRLLRNLRSVAEGALGRDLSQFVDPESERLKLYAGASRAVISLVKSEIERAQIALGNAKGQFFNLTAAPESKDDIGAVIKRKEIRESLRSMDIEDALNLLNKKILEENNLAFLHAIIDDPLGTFKPDAIDSLRIDYTKKNNPEAMAKYNKQLESYDETRKECAEFSGAAAQILVDLNLPNPITEKERWEAFPPRTAIEASMINLRVESEWKKEQAEERRKELEGSK